MQTRACSIASKSAKGLLVLDAQFKLRSIMTARIGWVMFCHGQNQIGRSRCKDLMVFDHCFPLAAIFSNAQTPLLQA